MNPIGRRWWPFLLLVATAGIAVGGLYRSAALRGPLVALEPANVELVDDPIEGDEVEIHLQLRNRSSSPVTITRAESSCGCMAVVARDGDLKVAPIVVAPRQSIPWRVDIRTLNRVGDQRFVVGFDYEQGRERGHVESLTRLHVVGGWKHDPSVLSYEDLEPGSTVVRDVAIYDALPPPGIPIGEILSSDPDHLKAELVPPRDADGSRKAELFGEESPYERRHSLRVSLTPGSDSAGDLHEAAVTILPVDTKRPSLYVPILYRTKAPRYRLEPTGLTLATGNGRGVVTREILCRPAADASRDLRVERKPNYADIQVKPSGDNIKITVTIDMSKIDEGQPGEIILSAGQPPNPALRIPIRWIRD